jgi:hypothetical protein
MIENNELKMVWSEAVVVISRHYPDIFLEELRITTEGLGQDSLCLSPDPNQSLPKYK